MSKELSRFLWSVDLRKFENIANLIIFWIANSFISQLIFQGLYKTWMHYQMGKMLTIQYKRKKNCQEAAGKTHTNNMHFQILFRLSCSELRRQLTAEGSSNEGGDNKSWEPSTSWAGVRVCGGTLLRHRRQQHQLKTELLTAAGDGARCALSRKKISHLVFVKVLKLLRCSANCTVFEDSLMELEAPAMDPN